MIGTERYISYNPQTGILKWKYKTSKKSPVNIGDEAGCLCPDGYRKIMIKGKQYQAHRLALYLACVPVGTGKEIDHINGDRSDNRLSNLRTVTRSVNNLNRVEHREGHLPGTHQTPNGKWNARVGVNGKQIYLGTFDTAEEAHQAWRNAGGIL
jgi:hypothetical protein